MEKPRPPARPPAITPAPREPQPKPSPDPLDCCVACGRPLDVERPIWISVAGVEGGAEHVSC